MVTRSDLPIGDQAVQAAHAAIDFCFEHPGVAKGWHESNYLVLLAVPDELRLWRLVDGAGDLLHTRFFEPDLGGALTAVCFEPRARKHLSNLRLLGGGEHG